MQADWLQNLCPHDAKIAPGDAWVIVETKVDVRSSTAWSQFDEAIGHFGGDAAHASAEPALFSEDEATDGDQRRSLNVSEAFCTDCATVAWRRCSCISFDLV